MNPKQPRRPWPYTAAMAMMMLVMQLYVPAFATAIRQVGMDEMLRRSQLVFEGVVTGRRVLTTAGGRPYTEVTFRIVDIIKGRWAKDSIRLSFMGGDLPGKSLRLRDMAYPERGEHGVYFVESTEKRLVNPLYGWSQGRFLVTRDGNGHERVETADGQQVTALHFGDGNDTARLSRGVAKGVRVKRQALGGEAMSLSDFKAQLRRQAGGREP